MRMTVTLDSDAGQMLRDKMRKTHKSFKKTLNEALRRGLATGYAANQDSFIVEARPLGLRTGVDPARLNQLIGVHVKRVLHLLASAAFAGGNLVTDAQITSIALAHRAIVHTKAHDFMRFPGLKCQYPFTRGRGTE